MVLYYKNIIVNNKFLKETLFHKYTFFLYKHKGFIKKLSIAKAEPKIRNAYINLYYFISLKISDQISDNIFDYIHFQN